MAGAYSDNQPDYNWSAPYETKTFSQYWYGIRDMGGVKAGDKNAAINMDVLDDSKSASGREHNVAYEGFECDFVCWQ